MLGIVGTSAAKEDGMNVTGLVSGSDSIRQYGVEAYVSPARRRGDKTFSINAGAVHKALGLDNLVPSVCNALSSKKFLRENGLRLVSKSGPPSGKSTSVTYTYEFLNAQLSPAGPDAWTRLRGSLKHVFAELGGGEAYLRRERDNFDPPRDRK
jgi:hypothetical protein